MLRHIFLLLLLIGPLLACGTLPPEPAAGAPLRERLAWVGRALMTAQGGRARCTAFAVEGDTTLRITTVVRGRARAESVCDLRDFLPEHVQVSPCVSGGWGITLATTLWCVEVQSTILDETGAPRDTRCLPGSSALYLGEVGFAEQADALAVAAVWRGAIAEVRAGLAPSLDQTEAWLQGKLTATFTRLNGESRRCQAGFSADGATMTYTMVHEVDGKLAGFTSYRLPIAGARLVLLDEERDTRVTDGGAYRVLWLFDDAMVRVDRRSAAGVRDNARLPVGFVQLYFEDVDVARRAVRAVTHLQRLLLGREPVPEAPPGEVF